MDMLPFYREENLFPREFTHVTPRPWGMLYHNADNPDSFDSNHALLYRTEKLSPILDEIVDFYRGIGAHPVIYQSILDDGWFGEIAGELSAAGFRAWQEPQHWMLLTADSTIRAEADIRRVTVWTDDLAEHLFRAASMRRPASVSSGR